MPNFYKKVVTEPKSTELKASKSIRGYFMGFLVVIILLLSIGYFVFKGGSFINTVNSCWAEIKFAYEKPNIVKGIREEYTAEQNKMDKKFMKKDQSSEEKLIDEVVKKLQADDLK